MRQFALISVVVLCVVVASCTADTPEPTTPLPIPTLTATSTITSTTTVPPTATVTMTVSPTLTVTPIGPQPWLLMRALRPEIYSALWAVHEDGGELVAVTEREPIMQYAVQPASADKDILIAYYRYEGEWIGDGPIYLTIVGFPSLETKLVIEVKMPIFAGYDPLGIDFVAYAHSQNIALAWSPDGSTLAFIGAMDGPDTDIYLYSAATNVT